MESVCDEPEENHKSTVTKENEDQSEEEPKAKRKRTFWWTEENRKRLKKSQDIQTNKRLDRTWFERYLELGEYIVP